MDELAERRRAERVKQTCIRFGSAAKRYIEAAEAGHVKTMLAEGVGVQAAMEDVAKAVTGTEVTP